MRSFLLFCIILSALTSGGVQAFAPSTGITRSSAARHAKIPVVGRTASSLALANNRDDEREVRVDLIEDVDPVTLTALGFGLIAFNFFVLGNLGDGGIGGVVARIMNTFG